MKSVLAKGQQAHLGSKIKDACKHCKVHQCTLSHSTMNEGAEGGKKVSNYQTGTRNTHATESCRTR